MKAIQLDPFLDIERLSDGMKGKAIIIIKNGNDLTFICNMDHIPIPKMEVYKSSLIKVISK